MKPLREALQDYRERPIDYRDPEYIERYLLNLGATTAIEKRVANATTMRDSLEKESSAWAAADSDLRLLTDAAQRYAWRDEIAAERPEGCWCLGVGGRWSRFTQAETKIFSETCGCPDGLRVKDSQERALVTERRQLEAERATRLFGKAQVPARFEGCTLHSFPASDAIKPSLAKIKDWLTPPSDDADEARWDAWIATNKRSLLLHGPYGVGKTGLAVGILRMKVADAGGGLFFTVPTLLDHIRRTYGPNPVADEHEIVQAVKTTPFLVLDDLGAERVTEWVREKLFTIINHRHDEDLPTVFTSNLDIAELGQHIGERTTWRIVEMATVIHVDGPNLRK